MVQWKIAPLNARIETSIGDKPIFHCTMIMGGREMAFFWGFGGENHILSYSYIHVLSFSVILDPMLKHQGGRF